MSDGRNPKYGKGRPRAGVPVAGAKQAPDRPADTGNAAMALRAAAEGDTAPVDLADEFLADDGRATRMAALASAAAVFVFAYMPTVSLGMRFGDGLELVSAAHVLGIPHPTGYPLYMILLKAWLSVTGLMGEAFARAALLNAALMALSGALGVIIAADSFRAVFPGWARGDRLSAAVAAGAGGVLLRFHWENAVVPEVYALQFALTMGLLRSVQLGCGGAAGALTAGAALLGLALAHHRMSLFMILPYSLAWIAWRRVAAVAGVAVPVLRRAVQCAALVAAGVSLYLYLPIRASARPAVNWGDPSTPARFLAHVRGGEFIKFRLLQAKPGVPFTPSTYIKFATAETLQIAVDFGGQAVVAPETTYMVTRPVQGPPGATMPDEPVFDRVFVHSGWSLAAAIPMLLLAAAGAWRLFRVSPWFAAAAGLCGAQHLALLYLYNIADIRDYYLAPFWLGWGAAALGAGDVAGSLAKHLRRDSPLPRLAPWLALAVPLAVGAGNFRRCGDHGPGADQLSAIALPPETAIVPPDSLVLTTGDNDSFTALYRQTVRGDRPDVLVVGANYLLSPWYRAMFRDTDAAKFHLAFSDLPPGDLKQFVDFLRTVIDPNLADNRAVFVTTVDPNVARALELSRYPVRPVAVGPVRGMGLFAPDDDTTVALLRIFPRTNPPPTKPDDRGTTTP